MHANSGDTHLGCGISSPQPLTAAAVPTEATTSPAAAAVAHILVLHADRIIRDFLHSCLQPLYAAALISVAASAAEAGEFARERPCDLLVTDVVASDGGLFDEIEAWTQEPARRVLVATSHDEPAVVEALSQTKIHGACHLATEGIDGFVAAVTATAEPAPYWSPELLHVLRTQCFRRDSVLASLSVKDRLVLSVIGDGCDDQEAAVQLGMPALTIKTVRRRLHFALDVQHRGELMQRALELGLVLQTPHGVVRPVLNRLRATYYAKRDSRAAVRRDVAA